MNVGDRIALDYLDRMTDSTGLVQPWHLWYSAARKRVHDRRQRPGSAPLRSPYGIGITNRRMLERVTVYLISWSTRVASAVDSQFSQLRPPLARCRRLR